jgi:uncharacterized membrane protein
MNRNRRVHFMAQAAVIAALYTVLTYVAAALNLAYGPVQFRFSEALTVLPVFTPAAIPGLAIGCLLSNLMSPLGLVDWICGPLATLLAALCTWWLRHVCVKDLPLLSLLPPAIFNAIIIGWEISCLSDAGTFSLLHFNPAVFWPNALSVGIGELVVCFVLGLALIVTVQKTNLHKRLFKQ